MSHWMPIETAPKDGSGILLWDGNTVRLCRWEPQYENIWNEKTETTGYRGAWTDDTVISFNYQETAEIENPTHWMKLPEPPSELLAERPDNVPSQTNSRVVEEKGSAPCPECQGVGLVKKNSNYRNTTCPTCKGTGQKEAKDVR